MNIKKGAFCIPRKFYMSHPIDYDRRIKELGLNVPPPPRYSGRLSDFVISGDLLYLSGAQPLRLGKEPYAGKLGKDFTTEEGYNMAREAALVALSMIQEALGTFNRVKRIVRVIGYVSSDQDFFEQGKVINGFSDLLLEVFGDMGRPTRLSLGVVGLSRNSPLEIELVAEISSV